VALVDDYVLTYKAHKAEQQVIGSLSYDKIPCINPPVFENKPVNQSRRDDRGAAAEDSLAALPVGHSLRVNHGVRRVYDLPGRPHDRRAAEIEDPIHRGRYTATRTLTSRCGFVG
jgi:hypothetical protein